VCIQEGLIESEEEVDAVIEDLREKDFYRFSDGDRKELYSLIRDEN